MLTDGLPQSPAGLLAGLHKGAASLLHVLTTVSSGPPLGAVGMLASVPQVSAS